MPVQVWNTADVSSRDQFAVWREVICEAFGALDPHLASPDQNEFRGRVGLTRIEAIRCAHVEAPPHRVLRARPEIRRDPQEAYFVNLQLAGSCVTSQAGTEALVRPGDFVVLDLTHPYSIDTRPGFSIICLRIPRSHLLPWVRDPKHIAGHTGRAETASGRIAASFMQAMWANGGDLPEAAGAPLGHVLSELVGLALADGTEELKPTDAAALRGAYTLIGRNLADPELSPGLVARELRISIRTLHAMFERSEESFGGYVRKQRLAQCAADLGNKADRRSISEIAWRWGFSDSAHFSRIFRNAYGLSPREFRTEKWRA
jgi:AraC family transcriptional regulator, positive regulator of tynA and feaB